MKPKVRFSSLVMMGSGIMLFPYALVTKKLENKYKGKIVANHESIHFYQAIETWVIGFYLLYFYYLFINFFKYGTLKKAYQNIPFEKEAYSNQYDLKYLENRKRFAWLDYKTK